MLASRSAAVRWLMPGMVALAAVSFAVAACAFFAGGFYFAPY